MADKPTLRASDLQGLRFFKRIRPLIESLQTAGDTAFNAPADRAIRRTVSPIAPPREKADIYTAAGILEYWVVDVNSARIHVMSESDGHVYRKIEIIVAPYPLAPQCLPNAVLGTKELFEVW